MEDENTGARLGPQIYGCNLIKSMMAPPSPLAREGALSFSTNMLPIDDSGLGTFEMTVTSVASGALMESSWRVLYDHEELASRMSPSDVDHVRNNTLPSLVWPYARAHMHAQALLAGISMTLPFLLLNKEGDDG